jgi:predicted kinase
MNPRRHGGLPGSGKSVRARAVAAAIVATYLRVDTVEAAVVSTLMPNRDNHCVLRLPLTR